MNISAPVIEADGMEKKFWFFSNPQPMRYLSSREIDINRFSMSFNYRHLRLQTSAPSVTYRKELAAFFMCGAHRE